MAGRTAFLMIGDQSAAEDVASVVATRCLDRVGDLDEPARRSYTYRATVRQVLDDRRSRDRRDSRERRAVRQEPPAASFDDAVAARLDILDALDQLPLLQRAAVILRYWADLTVDEIAVVCACRPGTVKSRLNRAHTTLRGLL